MSDHCESMAYLIALLGTVNDNYVQDTMLNIYIFIFVFLSARPISDTTNRQEYKMNKIYHGLIESELDGKVIQLSIPPCASEVERNAWIEYYAIDAEWSLIMMSRKHGTDE